MQQIDATAIATALPSIARALDAPILSLHAAISVYLLALGVFLPVSGWLADRFGAKQIFCFAIAMFTIASLLCGASTSLAELILARVVQGFGGALMLPTARLIIVRTVARSELVSAMVLMSLPVVIGPTVGPLFGGFIMSVSSWRWIFLINLPFGIAAILATWVFIEKVPISERKAFDIVGFLLSAVGIGAVIYGLDQFSDGAGKVPLILSAAGVASLVWYAQHARRRADPILDLSLFRYATFRSSLLGGSLFRMGFSTLPFMLPLLMQEVFGYTPLQSGAITFVAAIGAFGMRTILKKILRRFGFRRVLFWNALIASSSIGLCATFTPGTAPALMTAIILLGGFFRALETTSINTLAFAEVGAEEMSHATSLSQMAQRIAQSLGVAGAAALLRVCSGSSAVPTSQAFTISFIVVALVASLSSVSFFMLSRAAGDSLANREVEP
jgi:EmrB/QacA subfamily drug resistance transporter